MCDFYPPSSAKYRQYATKANMLQKMHTKQQIFYTNEN